MIPPLSPRALRTRWSLQRLRRYLVERRIVEHISVETIRQILLTQEGQRSRYP